MMTGPYKVASIQLNGKEFGSGEVGPIEMALPDTRERAIAQRSFVGIEVEVPFTVKSIALPYQLILRYPNGRPFAVEGMISPMTMRGCFYFDAFDMYALVDVVMEPDGSGDLKSLDYRGWAQTADEARAWIDGGEQNE